MTSNEVSTKKVRSACRRCRLRRIKCDGQAPACGNCSKAGVPCMDVDGRNAEQLIPRTFLVNGPARIRWLEDVIRTNLPDFDLTAGPQVDLASLEPVSAPTVENNDASIPFPAGPSVNTNDLPRPQSGARSPQSFQATKRSHASIASAELERPLVEEARSVVMDLGMLSLNSDSRQRHYLGSSSGLLFTRIIGTDSEDSPSPQPAYESSEQGPIRHRSISRSERGRTFAQHRQAKQMLQQLYRRLQSDLPTKDEAYSLLEVYFREIHPDHPLLHASSLLNAVEALYDSVDLGPNAPVGHNGWPELIKPFPYNGDFEQLAGKEVTPVSIYAAAFQVFMVFNLAATVRVRGKDFEVSPAKFYRAAMFCAADCFSSISLPSLQNLLLLAIRSLMVPAEINIWTLVHICVAHSIDLGIHREYQDLNEVARNVRRFVFYTTYALERSIATIQGRPLGIRDESFDVKMPCMDGMMMSNDVWASDSYNLEDVATQLMPYSIHNLKLYRIISNIKLFLYHLPTGPNNFLWPDDASRCQQKLQEELETWSSEISEVASHFGGLEELDPTEINRFKIKLELRYHAAMVLLHQPSQAIRNPSLQSLLLCFNHAVEQIRLYDTLHSLDSLYLSWRTVQSIFASGTVMIYCFWTSDALLHLDSFLSLPKELRTCSNLLSASGEWWPSVKRGKESFERIVDLTLRRWAQLQGETQPGNSRATHLARLALNSAARAGESPYDMDELRRVRGPIAVDSPSDGAQQRLAGTSLHGSTPSNLENDMTFQDPSMHQSAALNDPGLGTFIDPEIEAFFTHFHPGDSSWDFLDISTATEFGTGNG